MKPIQHTLNNGRLLLIREAAAYDAQNVLDFVHSISGETDFLSFGPGEFDLTVSQEESYLRSCLAADNQLYLLALFDETIVGTLNFTGGRRPRIRHTGEFGMVVRQQAWGLGIGGLLLDTLLQWAGESNITKINLRVRTDNHRAINCTGAKVL